MPSYSKAPSEVTDLVQSVIGKHHADLAKYGVTVDVLLDHTGLKLHGYECHATIRVLPYKQRIKGSGDSELMIDSASWKELNDEEREAVIDHEMQHLEVCKDKHNQIKEDNAGRPKLKMRLHDLVVGGFSQIIARHGEAAIEAQQLKAYFGRYRQQLLSWGDDQAPQDAPPSDIAGSIRAAV